MGQFLTPEELKEYDMRNSQTAQQLKSDLDVFDASEKEFRDIYDIKKAREDDLDYVFDPDDKAAQEKRNKAVEETDKQVKELLGNERFAEYKRDQDYSYKELVRLAERQGLPKETAANIYEMKKVAEDAVKKIQQYKSLTQVQRIEAWKAIQTETENSITENLGAKGLKKYKNRGGWWIRNLAPNNQKP